MSTVAEIRGRASSGPQLEPPAGARGLYSSARRVLLATLMIATLVFGAVQPWAWGGVICVACVCLMLWLGGCLRAGEVRIYWSPLYLLALALLVLGVVQMALQTTYDRVGTREALLKLAGFCLFLFVTQQLYLVASARRWRELGWVIAIFAFLVAAFAIVQALASPGKVYGAFQSASNAPFGPYINHTNYAGLMEMLIPVAGGLWMSLPGGHRWKLFLSFAVILSLVSVFLSGSRGGSIAISVELVLFAIVVFIAKGASRSTLTAFALLLVLGIGSIFLIDSGTVRNRWREFTASPELALSDRLQIARDTMRLFQAHPIGGVGLGAFEIAYTPYQTVITEHPIDFAHNDYMQLLAETGVAGLVIMLGGLGIFASFLIRLITARGRSQADWIRLGAAIGVCGILVNSLSDFNLHIPANAAWFSLLAGLATLKIPERRRLHN